MVDDLRARIAARFARLDAEQWGYDHGFCADPEQDEETASFVDAAIAEMQADPVLSSDQPDRCGRCFCSDCGGRFDQHTETGCCCVDCVAYPEVACPGFKPEEGIGYMAEQLGPLLSSHLNEAARLRCLAVAHAAYHFMRDYDSKGTLP